MHLQKISTNQYSSHLYYTDIQNYMFNFFKERKETCLKYHIIK